MQNQICRKNAILYLNIHLNKLFDVILLFSFRKHSAKAVSSGFFIHLNIDDFFILTILAFTKLHFM